MPLTADQVSQIRSDAGAPPVAAATTPSLKDTLGLTSAPAVAASNDTGDGSLLDRLGSDFTRHVDTAATAQEDAGAGKQSPISAAVQTAGEGAGMVNDVVTEPIKSGLNGLEGLLESFGGPTDSSTVPGADLPSITEHPAFQAIAQKVKEFTDAHPEASKNLGAVFNLATLIPGEGAAAGAAEGAAKGAAKAADAVKESGGVVDAVRNAASSANVGDQVEQAATNLDKASKASAANAAMARPEAERQGIGSTVIKNPAKTHEEFYNQEQNFKKDIKADTALGVVGSRVGDAFKKVVQQRQAAGKTMGAELEKFGSTPVSAKAPFGEFQKELLDNGATYDSLDHSITGGPESKFAPSDLKILDHYAGELQKLGANPTGKALDAFISRMPNEIKGLKSTAGINFTTNAERLVKNNLNGLRNVLGDAATPAYNAARAQYSDLSNFIKEGSGYLGKVTQKGDFAKDASLAKSAVQSLLNNGKKDWLLKLEQHTGYPALDESVLALQAMKDAGNFRGQSLLELLAEQAKQGGIPTNQADLLGRLASGAFDLGKKAIAGTPYEQTQRVLKGLMKKKP